MHIIQYQILITFNNYHESMTLLRKIVNIFKYIFLIEFNRLDLDHVNQSIVEPM